MSRSSSVGREPDLKRLRRPLLGLGAGVEGGRVRSPRFRRRRERGTACAARRRQHAPPRRALGGDQEPIGIPEALQRIEPRELRLPLRLHPLRLGEQRPGLRPLPGLMQGVGGGGAVGHLLKGIPAAVGEVDGAAAVGHRLAQPAQRHLQLAEVAGNDGGVLPSPTRPRPFHRTRASARRLR